MNLKNTVLGLELGSTRIKAILLDKNFQTIATGGYDWENQFINGIWTYSLEEIHKGLQSCYADLASNFQKNYGIPLSTVGAIGISGMMHGYLAFDKDGNQLAEFRTWRNTITEQSAAELSELFHFNIPQRWSIAHLYQAILNKEEHLPKLHRMFTLCAYIHYLLSGQHVIGIGEASGMFPIDSKIMDYDKDMVSKFDDLIKPCNFPWTLRDVLPKVLVAGKNAGMLSEEGAKFLDPSGVLEAGIPLAPPEGDAGTGMTATNSVKVYTGNVSAGTSDFAMVVCDKIPNVHREIDMVTTPAGHPVAMIHCNNCTSDINAWVSLFKEFSSAIGSAIDTGELFSLLFNKALEAEPDCGGLLSFNYLSGEGITDLNEGRPLFMRTPDAHFTLANFMRTHLLSTLATLKIGMDLLAKENVRIDKLYGHGGFFKTPIVGQTMLSAAVNAPVSVMQSAGEGGPYGMALLTAYLLWKEDNESLEDFLENKAFASANSSTLMASPEDIEGFSVFLERYRSALPIEIAAISCMNY